jgi:catechol 2,3-dioxygenase-like lactoylglutathione lyase family enzyme
LESDLNIKRIEHVSINVKDMQASLAFYEQVLGFKRLQTVDCGDFDITYFELPGGQRLELFDYHGNNPAATLPEEQVGLRHLAFDVEDVAAHEAWLRDKGVTITLPTCDLPNLGVRVLLFLDPNGVTLEFCEAL